MADIKTEYGRRLTQIGWDIDVPEEAQGFVVYEKNLSKRLTRISSWILKTSEC